MAQRQMPQESAAQTIFSQVSGSLVGRQVARAAANVVTREFPIALVLSV